MGQGIEALLNQVRSHTEKCIYVGHHQKARQRSGTGE